MKNDENPPKEKEEFQSIMGQPEQTPPLRLCVSRKLTQDAVYKNSALKLFEADFYYQLLVEATVYFELEMIDEALKRLEVYLKQFPNYAKGQNMIGLCYWLTENLGQAIAAFEKACKLEPENTEYLADLIHLFDHEYMSHHSLEWIRYFFDHNPKLRFELYTALRSYGVDHSFIQLAWKTRKQSKLKVLNGIPIMNASPMKK